MNSAKIKKVIPRQVFDSNGRPTIEVDIFTENGAFGRAGASTGTSVGRNESIVLRDGDPKLFAGTSVYNAIKNVEKIIAPALIGMDVTDQAGIDERMINLDGTEYKENLGGNTLNAVSFAVARAGAAYTGQTFYKYMAIEEIKSHFSPALNLINGGAYNGITQPFQEFMVIPRKVDTFQQAARIGVEMFYETGKVIQKYTHSPVEIGNYSGYGAPSDDPDELFDILMQTASNLGYQNHIAFAIDCASSEIYDEQRNSYLYRGHYVGKQEIISVLKKLCEKYPIVFVEDALQEEDFEGFQLACKEIPSIVIGDDFLCTNIKRAKKAVEMGAAQGMIIKPNQVGTLTETMETVRYLKERNLLMVASGRAGGVLDDPTTDLSVAVGAQMLKTGAPRSGERIISINDGLRIEEEMNFSIKPYDVSNLRDLSKFEN